MTPTEVIGALAGEPARAGLVLDFDGTLAPIVEDPATSALPDGAAGVLGRIARRLAVVAIVSGRPAAFLADRVDIGGVRMLGLYGTEEWRDGRAVARDEVVAFEPRLDEARERITLALAGHEGVLFEDKGLALALHWRNAPDRAAAERFVTDLVADVARDAGLRQEPGKFVAELRPAVDWDKGTTVTALASEARLASVVYVGDDRGDLAAFAAVREAGGIAVAVDHGSETPHEVLQGADVVLPGTDAVHAWLTQLADALE